MSETTASHLSHYTSLVEVVSSAFGGSKTPTRGEYTEDLSQATPEHFLSRFNSMMSL